MRFDPYSPTAEEDYETLIEHLSGYDVLGMLAREMRKSRVHQQLTRKLLYAAKYIDDGDVDSATITVAENLRSLLTVFTSVASLLASLLPRIQPNTRAFLERKLARLLEDDESLGLLELHRMIIVRLIAGLDNVDGDTDNVIWRQFAGQDSVLVQKECIWALLRLKRANLIRPLLDRFDRSSQWERRAMLAASFVLEGEGEAFRARVRSRLSAFEELVVKWCEKRGGRLFAEES